MSVYGLFQRALMPFVDGERAHELTIATLKAGLIPPVTPVRDPRIHVKLWDLDFSNPVGMAAGFDKNAEVPDALLKLGFGFAEVGTLTPRPQPGNPRPRIFRDPAARAVVNRLGFNNEGHEAALARLKARAGRGGIVGVNVGANKDADDRMADYVTGIRTFAAFASYFTVNISSPNTPGLRDLQARDALDDLLARVMAAREETVAGAGHRVPVLLKIAPDVTDEGLADIAEVALARKIDGLIVSNTTLERNDVSAELAAEAGGLSGRPLFHRSTVILARMRRLVGPELPIVGVGGIASGADAFAKIAAGADLVQLYTGFVYEGPGLATAICRDLLALMERSGLSSLADLKGRDTEIWADKTP
ncbi:Dihydroorotate dehydrogenase (quinone) [Hartmannibacter diazotrophicus]|uniref:Dihydroorotate dehydrogenase (quinone) n=1 Tax=Hartmannibacter diazotrophicus TaxID=1482074 RepID=A0A2C9DDU0_9HYPH|nr:quinone-dependent dihydroorotate dehydrogenase [Hartmannibacter diazotrophicus]SON58340.1 Dihydroorotate dehydrogenase (quinone) [Hartmannibacter diazotrophicus]